MDSEVQDDGVRIELLGRLRGHGRPDRVGADAWPSRRPPSWCAARAGRRAPPAARAGHRGAVADAGARRRRREPAQGRPPRAAGARRAGGRGPQGGPGRAVSLPARSRPTSPRSRRRPGALDAGDESACAAGGRTYAGELLPEARTRSGPRRRASGCARCYVELLRRSGQWERLVAVEPTDEPAYRELMRARAGGGQPPGRDPLVRPAAHRAARASCGSPPGADTQALYDECVAGLEDAAPAAVGRQLELARATACCGPTAGRAGRARRPRPGGDRQVGALPRARAHRARTRAGLVVGVTATEAGGPYAPVVSAAEQLAGTRPEPARRRWRSRAARCWPS